MDKSRLRLLSDFGVNRPAEKADYWRGMRRKEEMEQIFDKYPEIPRTVVLKADLQRVGVDFTERAFEEISNAERYEHTGRILFLFHMTQESKKAFDIPSAFAFNDGTNWMIRLGNPENDIYTVDFVDGKFWLTLNGELLEELNTEPRPPYYDKKTSSGISMRFVGVCKPSDSILFVPYRHCHYWNTGDQCRFCDMNYYVKFQLKVMGRQFSTRNSPEDLYETMTEILKEEGRWRHFCITGGSDPRRMYESEFDFYFDCCKAFQKAFKESLGIEHMPLLLVLSPFKKDEMIKLRDEAGVARYQPNIEVWDAEKFPLQCPGKAKNLGRDEWIKRTLDAVEVFGEGNVESSLVTGTMMAPEPYGYPEIDEAVAADLEGIKFFVDNGVKPIDYIWYCAPGSYFHKIGANWAPLEYYMRLNIARHNVLKNYNKEKGHAFPYGATDFRCCPHGIGYDTDRLL
ncbi:MAG: radical SAM protein [Thermodesulfobacteriota bacterium]|nr:radical SAM protein [Thermodesulfobacteriota bacterium]